MNERQRLLLWRAASCMALALCGGVTAMLAWHRSAHPVWGNYSIHAAAALALAALGTGLWLLVALLPAATLERLAGWLSDGVRPLCMPRPRGSPGVGIVLLLLAVVSYLTLAARFARERDRPGNDELDYLRVAAEIRANGGVGGLVRQLWDGT